MIIVVFSLMTIVSVVLREYFLSKSLLELANIGNTFVAVLSGLTLYAIIVEYYAIDSYISLVFSYMITLIVNGYYYNWRKEKI